MTEWVCNNFLLCVAEWERRALVSFTGHKISRLSYGLQYVLQCNYSPYYIQVILGNRTLRVAIDNLMFITELSVIIVRIKLSMMDKNHCNVNSCC